MPPLRASRIVTTEVYAPAGKSMPTTAEGVELGLGEGPSC
jgi:hypothetical protein